MIVPLDPAAPERMNSARFVWPVFAVKIPPKLVRFSQIAPGTMVLAALSQTKFGVPVISPATSFFLTGSVPSNSSP